MGLKHPTRVSILENLIPKYGTMLLTITLTQNG